MKTTLMKALDDPNDTNLQAIRQINFERDMDAAFVRTAQDRIMALPLEIASLFFMSIAPNSRGNWVEKWIINHYGFNYIKKKCNNGDFVNKKGVSFELKTTILTGTNDTANFVQIRLPNNKHYNHLCMVIDTSFTPYKIYPFLLSMKNMRKEVKEFGSHLAHGTDHGQLMTNKEYAIHLNWHKDIKARNRWEDKYLLKTLDDINTI